MDIPGEGHSLLDRISAQQKIEEFARLPENWDGYGALPIKTETIQHAFDALARLPDEVPTPDIIPNANGTISFEWESPAGIGHLEVGRRRYSFYLKPRDPGQPVLKDYLGGGLSLNIGELLIRHLCLKK